VHAQTKYIFYFEDNDKQAVFPLFVPVLELSRWYYLQPKGTGPFPCRSFAANPTRIVSKVVDFVHLW